MVQYDLFLYCYTERSLLKEKKGSSDVIEEEATQGFGYRRVQQNLGLFIFYYYYFYWKITLCFFSKTDVTLKVRPQMQMS